MKRGYKMNENILNESVISKDLSKSLCESVGPAILIEAEREGYDPEQCENTMTVKELIEVLSDYSGDTKVYISNDNGYTYGSIKRNSIREYEG